jgi:hypothetical protein
MESPHPVVGGADDAVAEIRELLGDDRVERKLRILADADQPKLAVRQQALTEYILLNSDADDVSWRTTALVRFCYQLSML